MTKELAAPKNPRLDTLRAMFEKAKPSIASVLPKHLTAERILKITLSAASRTPDLLLCTPQSILLAVMQSATLGMEPNTPLGEAYLIPFKNRVKVKGEDGKEYEETRMEAQFMPGYRGLLKLAIQSGEVQSITARPVYERDDFEVEYGLDEKLVHRPYQPPVPPPRPQGPVKTAAEVTKRNEDLAAWRQAIEDGGHGQMLAVYAVAVYKGGGKTFELMWRTDVDSIRLRSKSADSGPWVTDFDQMALKTVIRRLCKRLPLSPELATALHHQARAEAGDGPDFSDAIDVLAEDPDAAPTPRGKSALGLGAATRTAAEAIGDGDTRERETVTAQAEASATAHARKAPKPAEGSPEWFAAHLAGIPDAPPDKGAGHVAASFWKRSDDFDRAGTSEKMRVLTCDELRSRGIAEPEAWLQAVGVNGGHIQAPNPA